MEKLQFPNRITVELTNQCNVSCTFCPRQSIPMKIGFMEWELYKKIIDEASQHLPMKLVIFFRGESLLHPQFVECVRYAKEKGIGPIQYASNAFEFNEELAEQIVDSGLDFISFSLDTINPEVYKRTRLAGDLNKSMANVRYLSELCNDRKNKGLKVPTIQVSTIKISDYLPDQKEFIEYWKKYVDVVRVYYEHDDKGQFRDCSIKQELEKKVPIRQPCRKIFTDLLVYWDGKLALCNYDWQGGLEGLNLNTMTIKEAWDSPEYEKLRQMHKDNRIDPKYMCAECHHWMIDYVPEGFLGEAYRNTNK